MVRAEAPPGRSATGSVRPIGSAAALTVHVVDRLTPSLLRFLLPTLEALRQDGVPQVLLHAGTEDGNAPPELERPNLAVLTVADHFSPLLRRKRLASAIAELDRQRSISVLYLHGLLPSLAAMRWLNEGGHGAVELIVSPHGAQALQRPSLLGMALSRLLWRRLGPNARHTIVTLAHEAQLLRPITDSPVQLVESPVPQLFFEIERHEARRPLLLSCSVQGQRATIDRYARVAVLMTDESLGVGFNWMGPPPSDEAAAALKAAGIGMFDGSLDATRAQRLSTAWIYVAPTEEPGFPVRLAEAMAAGLPCVAVDCAAHRSVLQDGSTGFLCADLPSLLHCVAVLIDNLSLRQVIGAAARQAAQERFSETVFRDRLHEALGVVSSFLPDPEEAVTAQRA